MGKISAVKYLGVMSLKDLKSNQHNEIFLKAGKTLVHVKYLLAKYTKFTD